MPTFAWLQGSEKEVTAAHISTQYNATCVRQCVRRREREREREKRAQAKVNCNGKLQATGNALNVQAVRENKEKQ